MNPQSLKRAKLLFDLVKRRIKNVRNTEVVICPPFPFILNLKSDISSVKLGAQDCFWEEKGAFTGEVSPLMLKNLGVKYIIIGHSERRNYQEETNEMIEKKLKAALVAGLKPILCIDKLSQIPQNIENWKLKIGNLILAFEPLSAIGTGKPYNVETAKKMRSQIKYPFVLYGGSANSQNAADYVKKAGFQGLLVGGASLNAQEFIQIVKNVSLD